MTTVTYEIGSLSEHVLNILRDGLISGTVTQADVLHVLHREGGAARCEGVIDEARTLFAGDDVEIDDFPLVSEGEEGTWVSAWVYVPLPEEDEDEAEPVPPANAPIGTPR